MKGKIGSVHRRGKKGIYVAEWMHHGKRFNVSTKTTNKAEAEKVLEELTRPFRLKDEESITEALVHKVRGKAREVCPIAELPVKVREIVCEDIAEGTWALYSTMFDQFNDFIAENHRKLSDIGEVTVEIADEFLDWLKEAGNSWATVNLKRTKMSRVWKELKAPVNVWRETRKRKGVHQMRECLTKDEAKKLISESTGFFHRMFVVAWNTGMRMSDCVNLDWKNIDWNRGKQGIIHLVPQKTKKTGREIQVPVSDALLKEMKEWGIGKEGKVCGRIEQVNVDRTVNCEIRRILGEHCGKSFHSFRHAFISDLGNRGVPLQMVRVMVGHMSEEMTQKYFHAQDDALDAIMSKR